MRAYDDDVPSVRECMTDREIGLTPECARGDNCLTWDRYEAVANVTDNELGLCALCATEEIDRALDSVTLENEERDDGPMTLLVEALRQDPITFEALIERAMAERNKRRLAVLRSIRELEVVK
jgi:hypothetical protein